MRGVEEIEISKAIISAYHEKLTQRIVNDVLIVGAGPSGMTAAFFLAQKGLAVSLLEKRLAPSQELWGESEVGEISVRQALIEVIEHASIHLGELHVTRELALREA